jgi:replication factor A1
MWGNTAEGVGRELEEAAIAAEQAGQAPPVVAISSCRVSSYNGVSVSSVGRSTVLINPTPEQAPEAAGLREWYEAAGRGAATSHVGEGLATAIK